MKTITINVTKRDIKNGKPGARFSCPIALSATRKTGQCVIVDEGYIEIQGVSMALPAKAKAFVHAFDLGKPVKPIKFPVRVP